MDPLIATVATTVVALVGTITVAWRLRRRIRRVEAHAIHLRRQLRVEQHAANHDPLTGLPNRRGFFQLAEVLVADPTQQPLVAVVLDVDDFKQVNDRLGHAAGDEALVLVARRFAAWAARGPWRAGDRGGDREGPQPLVARLGGDEFAALLSAATPDHRWWQHAAWQLTETLAAPMEIAGHQVTLTGSVGLTVVGPQPGAYRPKSAGTTPLAEALRSADAAMYRAKTGNHPTRVAAGGDSPAVTHPRHQSLPDARPDRHLVDVTPTSGGQPR